MTCSDDPKPDSETGATEETVKAEGTTETATEGVQPTSETAETQAESGEWSESPAESQPEETPTPQPTESAAQ